MKVTYTMAGITKVLEKEVNGLQVNLAAKKQHFNEQRIRKCKKNY